jgi:hypothetical protein
MLGGVCKKCESSGVSEVSPYLNFEKKKKKKKKKKKRRRES